MNETKEFEKGPMGFDVEFYPGILLIELSGTDSLQFASPLH